MDVHRWARVILVVGALGLTLAACEDRDMGTSGSGVWDPGPNVAGEDPAGPDWAEDDEEDGTYVEEE